TAFCAVAVAKLEALPPLTTVLPQSPSASGARKLVVASPSGLLIVESSRAFRLNETMQLQPIAWPSGLHVDDVLSVAQSHGTLALIYRNGHARGVLTITGDRAVEVAGLFEKVIAVHPSATGFELYSVGGTPKVATFWRGELDPPFQRASVVTALPELDVAIHLDAVEGMVWMGSPLLMVGERGANWLVGLDGTVKPMMVAHAASVWSASYANVPIGRGSEIPFIDAKGTPHFLAMGAPYLAFTTTPAGELAALSLDRAGDDAIETAASSAGIELQAAPGRLLSRASARTAWRPIASTPVPAGFAAFPVGAHWIALSGDATQSALLDARGARLHPTTRAATILAVTGHSSGFWIGGLTLVLLLGCALPLFVARTLFSLKLLEEPQAKPDAPNARGLFLGTLEAPPGAVLASDRSGRVHLSGACRLRAGGVTLELEPGPRRYDPALGVPLVGGDQVYVVGRVGADGEGGPWRASQRKRIGPERGRYLIGRGTAADFARHLVAHQNAQLTRFALVQLACALTLLLALGLRPFA
ncbi:MAG TPA: hypothetical protein VII38_23550, partial [Polyangia bacterium]